MMSQVDKVVAKKERGEEHPRPNVTATVTKRNGVDGAATLEKTKNNTNRTAINQKVQTKASKSKEKKAAAEPRMKRQRRLPGS